MNTEPRNGNVELETDGQTTIIRNITIRDEEVYTLLQATEKEKRTTTLIDAIKIGICGLKQIRTGAELNYIENGFNKMISKFEFALNPNLPNSSVYRLIHLLQDYFENNGRLETILNPSTQNGPLNKLQCEIRGEIQKLRDLIIKKETEAELVERSPAKGYKFEDEIEIILSKISSNNLGDELERKTNEVGEITGCLTGDFIITPRETPAKKVVLEVKDVENISQNQILETLERAMTNRGASYGIFVVKFRESMPRKIGMFNEFRQNMLVVALGSKTDNIYFPELVLNLAFQWAKMRLATRSTSMEQVAIAVVAEGAKHITQKLEAFSRIHHQCTNANKAIEEIRHQADEIRDEIDDEIKKIQRAIISSDGKDVNDRP